jgi:hypothetical protein
VTNHAGPAAACDGARTNLLDWSPARVPLRLGLKVVDLAGNANPASEIELR